MTEGKIVGLYYFLLKFEQFLNNISAVLGLFWMLEGKMFFKSEFFLYSVPTHVKFLSVYLKFLVFISLNLGKFKHLEVFKFRSFQAGEVNS